MHKKSSKIETNEDQPLAVWTNQNTRSVHLVHMNAHYDFYPIPIEAGSNLMVLGMSTVIFRDFLTAYFYI